MRNDVVECCGYVLVPDGGGIESVVGRTEPLSEKRDANAANQPSADATQTVNARVNVSHARSPNENSLGFRAPAPLAGSPNLRRKGETLHFRIFIPDAPATASPEHLMNVGLGHLAEGFHAIPHQGSKDIADGKNGAIYFWPRPGDSFALPKKPLTWIPAVRFRGLEAGRYFIGYDPDSLPRSSELLVPLPIPGEHLPLVDASQTWIVPDFLFLPAGMVLTADGVKLERLSRYQQRTFNASSWIRQCESFTNQIRSGRVDDSIEWDKAWGFGYDSLCLNFRLTPEVVNLLNLLSTDSIVPLILAAIGSMEMYRKQHHAPEALVIPGMEGNPDVE